MTILHRSCMGWNGAMSKARAVAKRTRKDTRVAWLEDGRCWAIYQGAAPRGAGAVSVVLAHGLRGLGRVRRRR